MSQTKITYTPFFDISKYPSEEVPRELIEPDYIDFRDNRFSVRLVNAFPSKRPFIGDVIVAVWAIDVSMGLTPAASAKTYEYAIVQSRRSGLLDQANLLEEYAHAELHEYRCDYRGIGAAYE